MITQNSIHNAVATTIKNATGLVTYSNEVTEGFESPCFFCKVSFERQPANLHTDRVHAEVALNYLPRPVQNTVRDEEEGNRMLSTLAEIFRGQLSVEERKLFIQNNAGDFAGTNYDIGVFSFTMDFFDEAVREKVTAPVIEHVDISHDMELHMTRKDD